PGARPDCSRGGGACALPVRGRRVRVAGPAYVHSSRIGGGNASAGRDFSAAADRCGRVRRPVGWAAMSFPAGWQNPITAAPGQVQRGVDPARLLPSRGDLVRPRVEFQRALVRSGRPRLTPIQVTPDGVIFDGHHGVRAAAEEGTLVDVLVIPWSEAPA